ncbi:hypothetical protein L1987_14461 [Smallanthus sonchifolius]|uniref:Uncharacterized protein n=1 Tax=Smallanthus sonchifolius TaxID=185202 RepID=A0ACB9J542_9ASTR|nr:hypothetical protein L1987_14461 [Smallanthus sonchifolius]
MKNKSSRWFLQPSYIMEHLLLKEGRLSSDVAALEKAQNLPMDNPGTVWKTANEYFFKSISSLGHLQKVCFNFHKDFTLEQEMLDNYLFSDCGSLISTSVVLYPYGITKQMEKFVQQNFLLIKNFKEKLLVIREEDLHAGLAKKGNLLDEYYNSALEERSQWVKKLDADDILRAEVWFTESLRKTCKQIVDGFDRVNSDINSLDSSDDYLGNINNWQSLFASRAESLQLYTIHDELVKTLNFAGELMNLYGNEETSIGLVEVQLKHLYSLLDLLINFGDNLLNDFMIAHSTLCMVTHTPAEIFASLYSQGFGCSTENQEEDNGAQDATGTGMGEGAGVKDVSEQIEDEDQLLGTEKVGEEQDALNEAPSKNDKGIEMEQDFNADAFSVSKDETDDENNDESDEPELDSAMGETGDDSKIVDEKLGENNDDEKNEKYETGPSVKEDDSSNRELRAKEDDVATIDEAGELDPDESNKQNDDNAPDDGLKPDEPNVDLDDDIDMNQQDDVEHNEDEGTETIDEEENNPDENGPEALTENFEMETEEADQENHPENKTDADMGEQKTDIAAPVANGFDTEHQQNYESATQPNSRSNGASTRSEVTWSNSDDMQSDLAPIQGLPNSSQNEVSVAGSGKLNDEHISQLPEADPSSHQKNEPNPLRNIGDALDGWKERAKVSVDLEEKKTDPMDGDEDQNADEFGFTSWLEKGMAQALGSAATDQVDKNIDMKESADGVGPADLKDDSEMDIEDQHHEAQPVKNHPLNTGNTIHDKMEVEETEIPDEVFDALADVDRSQIDSSAYVRRSYLTDDVSQLSVVDDDMGKSHNLEDVSGEMKDYATALWRKYELQTTRLSQ